MEEDIRKQGMLYLQQQRFGKVRTSLHGEITVKLMLMKISDGVISFLQQTFKLTFYIIVSSSLKLMCNNFLSHVFNTFKTLVLASSFHFSPINNHI